ncbi:D-lactate dehydrogenase [Methanoculleus bourgensis MS2]|uniref:D-lactate dehydrogenase n=1 Tax=Methanoculleus bourgensis (strain ATCC 43281 / DSM 3045 / OCM 15 / MS2) TaxID=1201294 RepID=I7KDQ5_METBM|nr:NAD(P)-dependent oxidoreductase [Methanoculleus bourgensis]CCJ37096.1 D-lactate dehydrogenase [Methanoculleus bourgensis MS2]
MIKLVFFDLDEHEQDVVRDTFAGESGYEVDLHSDALTSENASLAHDADGIGVFVTSHVTREVLDRLPNLNVVAAMSTGFDHIDVDACRERNIAVCNVPLYGDTTVAEFAFGLILALARKFRPTFARTARGDFSRTGLQGMDLAGKTLGLIGTGRIGSHLARIAHAAGMNVVAYDLHPNPALTKDYGVRYLDLDDLLREADVISLHVPYTKATHHLINADRLRLVRDTALLVNTSRGGVVDTRAVAAALREGRLGGVALDTFEGERVWIEEEFSGAGSPSAAELKEALESFAILQSDRAILSPHNAFNTREALGRILATSIENIRAFFAGNPQNIVAGTYRVPAAPPTGGGRA